MRLGAGPLTLVAAGELSMPEERLGAFVEVPADVCLLAYARAAQSVEDLDVAVYSEEGTPIAIDEASDVHPTVLLCPPHPDRVYVTARAPVGEGLVAVAAQLVPKQHAVLVARALGARGSLAEGPRPAEAVMGLDDVVRTHQTELGGTWELFRKTLVSADTRAPTFVAFPLEADQCTDAVVVPGEGVAMLDVEALDGDGRVLARARDGTGARALTVCSPLAIVGTLAIRPHVGRGPVAVVLSRARGEVARDLSAHPEVAWAAPSQPLEATRSARNGDLAKRGYDAPTATVNGALALGKRVTVPLDLRSLGGAQCARIDVVAGAPLALVEGAIWDDAGALVASGEGAASVALFACVKGGARLDLETRGRPGPFSVLVRPERWKDPAFSSFPLAASRMLARAATGPTTLHEGKESPARTTTLDAAHLSSWSETIPAAKCLRIAAGAQGDGAGLSVRIFDATSSSELDRSEAPHAVSVRACAPPDASRAVKIELRASSGKLDVVIATRTSS
jgi:hypothetical protein